MARVRAGKAREACGGCGAPHAHATEWACKSIAARAIGRAAKAPQPWRVRVRGDRRRRLVVPSSRMEGGREQGYFVAPEGASECAPGGVYA